MNIKKILCNLDLLIASLALLILIVVTFGGVIMRYFLGSPLVWAEEVQLWCFLWATFLGGGAAFRYGSHVGVEIVVELLPKNIQKFIETMNLIIILAVLGYLLFLGFDIMALMMKIGKATNILHIPFAFINAVLPVSCVVMMISAVSAFIVRGRQLKDPVKEN